MFKIQVEPYSGCMSQSPNLPFTYLFMLTDYVIIHQQKDQHRRTKIHHLTARGKLISTMKLAEIYHYFSTNEDTRVKRIHSVMILQENQFCLFGIIFTCKNGKGQEPRINSERYRINFYSVSIMVANIHACQ